MRLSTRIARLRDPSGVIWPERESSSHSLRPPASSGSTLGLGVPTPLSPSSRQAAAVFVTGASIAERCVTGPVICSV
jgi:hypothetical protein